MQEKKFIDTVDKLTIFIENKNSSEEFENIFLKDDLGNNKSQIIFAKKGTVVPSKLPIFPFVCK